MNKRILATMLLSLGMAQGVLASEQDIMGLEDLVTQGRMTAEELRLEFSLKFKKDIYSADVLHDAARSGAVNALEWLLDSCNVDVNIQDKLGRTALHQAASRGNIDAINTLLSRGAKINARSDSGWTALFFVGGVHCDVVKVLVDAGADINIQDKNGLTALHKAVSNKDIDLVKELLSNGADVNTQDKNGETALHDAVRGWNLDIVKELLSHDADVNLQNKDGETALHCASRGSFDVVKELLSNGADVDFQDKKGKTALHNAARYWNLKTAIELLKNGADANIQDNEGKMAFDRTSSSEMRRLIAKHMKQVGWKQWLKCYLI